MMRSPPGSAPASAFMRIAAKLSACFLVGALLAGLGSYVVYEQRLDGLLWEDARDHALALEQVLSNGGADELGELIDLYVTAPHAAQRPVLWIEGGQVLGNLPTQPDPREGALLLSETGGELQDRPMLGRGNSLHVWSVKTAGGWIMAAEDSRVLETSRALFATVAGWSLAGAVALTTMLAWALARHNARRMADLDAALMRAMEGDLSARVTPAPQGQDDLGWVARRVNEMLRDLEASVQEMQQVSVALAHDLRRPLQRVRARLEPHVTGDCEPIRADLEAALVQLEALNRSFDAILRLSRIESGACRVARDPVDLRALVLDVAEMLEPVAEDRGQTLIAQADRPVHSVLGDQAMIQQALVNLVENAFRHGPSGTAVRIGCAMEDEVVRVWVCDNGPGIPADKRSAALKRFVRLDETRGDEGSGLGLSMVSAIARRHNAALELSDAKPGLCVEMRFAAM